MRATFWAALLAHQHLATADLGPYIKDSSYVAGKYGRFPLESYITFENYHVPRLHIIEHSPECDDGRLYFLTPSLNAKVSPFDHAITGISVFDTRGSLIWHKISGESSNYERITHVKVQTYRGAQYITYFIGNVGITGHGAGIFHMLDANYNLAYTIRAHGDIDADFHEFSITEQGTAILTAYSLHPADLTRWGDNPEGQAWDSIFQEIDIETNELLFEWRATDHFSFDDMVVDAYSRDDVANTDGFDWYHINSVEKDPMGNYLISSRYASAVTYVDGQTGQTIWNLGGRNNNFRDISKEADASTNIFCQHMARWTDNYTAITLFDNQAYWDDKRRPARILKIRLDTEEMTSELVQAWQHPRDQWSESAGGAMVLEGSGNILVGYGYQPIISEYSPNGTLICDMAFASQGLDEVHVKTGGQKSYASSYRTFKQSWSAQPLGPPSTAVVDDSLFVSWNGATEVRAWSLEFEDTNGRLISAGRVQKDSFESSISVRSASGLRIRHFNLTALGDGDHIIGSWLLDSHGRMTAGTDSAPDAFYSSVWYLSIAVAVFIVIVRLGLGARRSTRLYKTYNIHIANGLDSTLRFVQRVLPMPLPLLAAGRKAGGGYEPVRSQEMEHMSSGDARYRPTSG